MIIIKTPKTFASTKGYTRRVGPERQKKGGSDDRMKDSRNAAII